MVDLVQYTNKLWCKGPFILHIIYRALWRIITSVIATLVGAAGTDTNPTIKVVFLSFKFFRVFFGFWW